MKMWRMKGMVGDVGWRMTWAAKRLRGTSLGYFAVWCDDA